MNSNFFVFKLNKEMPKAKLPKVFKVKKEKEADQFIVRFKNLSKQQIKEFKAALDAHCQQYFHQLQE